jgi:hypothetical protein
VATRVGYDLLIFAEHDAKYMLMRVQYVHESMGFWQHQVISVGAKFPDVVSNFECTLLR